MTIPLMGLKLKVGGQGIRVRVNSRVRVSVLNAMDGISNPNRGQFVSQVGKFMKLWKALRHL